MLRGWSLRIKSILLMDLMPHHLIGSEELNLKNNSTHLIGWASKLLIGHTESFPQVSVIEIPLCKHGDKIRCNLHKGLKIC